MKEIASPSQSYFQSSLVEMHQPQDITYEGRSQINQLGRKFFNGRPLPHHLRMKIINMARQGIRASAISRELGVSHGCISKILTRYGETGSIEPGSGTNSSQSDILADTIKEKILEYKNANKNNPIFIWQIRQRLIQDGICTPTSLPNFSVLDRILSDDKNKQPNVNKKNSHKLEKTRRHRTSLNHYQIEILEKCFQETPYPDVKIKDKLSKSTQLSEKRIQVWFSNRRARLRKVASAHQQLQLQLPATIGSLPCHIRTIGTNDVSVPKPTTQCSGLRCSPYCLLNCKKPSEVINDGWSHISNRYPNSVNMNNSNCLFVDQQSLLCVQSTNDYENRYPSTITHPNLSSNLSGSFFSSANSFTSSSSFYTPNMFNIENGYL